MSKQIPKLSVESRSTLGTRHTARLRKTGRLPAVIYGHGQDPLHVHVDAKQFTELLHNNAHLIEAVADTRTEPCLIKDVQWDHLGSKIIHADLARVDLNEKVTVEVSLEIVGEPAGVKEAGAFLENPLDTIEVECLATNIPDSIRVDVSSLKVDDSITAGEIALPEGVTLASDPDQIVAAVHVAEEETAEAVPGAEEKAEPELIRKPAGEEGENEK